jgi:hypothetical protein
VGVKKNSANEIIKIILAFEERVREIDYDSYSANEIDAIKSMLDQLQDTIDELNDRL